MKAKHCKKLLIFSVVEFIVIIILAVIASEQKHRVYFCKAIQDLDETVYKNR